MLKQLENPSPVFVLETFLMVPSPTPFCPASSSSRSLKLRGITKTKHSGQLISPRAGVCLMVSPAPAPLEAMVRRNILISGQF